MRILILTLIAISISPVGFADMPSTGIKIYCKPSDGEFRFNAETTYDEWTDEFLKEAKANNYILAGKFDFKCKLDTNKIRLWGEIYEPSASGECGGNPGGKIFISVNGLPILHYLTFGNACSATVWRGSISIHRRSNEPAKLELCGYKRLEAWDGKEPKCVARSFPLTQPLNKKQKALFYQDDLERMVGDD